MSNGKRILIVDDDPVLLEMLSEQLKLHEEFLTSGAATAGEALDQAKEDYFDVILLDVGLPDMDGREVCRLMRRNGVTSPIIMLTGADTDADTILGLDAGANDYITKPFRLGVLLARLRAHIRQHERSDDAVFTIGPYTFEPSNKQLVNNEDEKKVRLTDKETAILKYLYRAGDKVVSRDVLLVGAGGRHGAARHQGGKRDGCGGAAEDGRASDGADHGLSPVLLLRAVRPGARFSGRLRRTRCPSTRGWRPRRRAGASW